MSDATQFVLPRGFRFGAAQAGLKTSGRDDFALIVADAPASAAAAFTANRVTAAPLILDKQHLRATGGMVRVVAINAGNANCAARRPQVFLVDDEWSGRDAVGCKRRSGAGRYPDRS